MDPGIDARTETPRPGLVFLSLMVGLLVFFLGVTFAELVQPNWLLVQCLLVVGLLVTSLGVRRSPRLHPYWRVVFVYFIASCALLSSSYAGDWAVLVTGRSLETVEGFTALKLGEDAAIVVTIVALALLSRTKLAELFLTGGRLRLGLVIGLSSFIGLSLLGLMNTTSRGVTSEQILGLLPAYGLVVLADGFMEELLFRGLFLRQLARFMSGSVANVVTAVVFALAHLQVEFTASIPVFVFVVFLLGLLFGWIMQRTESILAPALIHAGVDMLVIADAFAAYGVGG
jgi:membrane protease YdiL (CAAX protease family)